jgi:hypothetical protein
MLLTAQLRREVRFTVVTRRKGQGRLSIFISIVQGCNLQGAQRVRSSCEFSPGRVTKTSSLSRDGLPSSHLVWRKFFDQLTQPCACIPRGSPEKKVQRGVYLSESFPLCLRASLHSARLLARDPRPSLNSILRHGVQRIVLCSITSHSEAWRRQTESPMLSPTIFK